MTIEAAQAGYAVRLSRRERDALLVALELAIGTGRGERAGLRGLVAELDLGTLDALADALFLAGVPLAATAATVR